MASTSETQDSRVSDSWIALHWTLKGLGFRIAPPRCVWSVRGSLPAILQNGSRVWGFNDFRFPFWEARYSKDESIPGSVLGASYLCTQTPNREHPSGKLPAGTAVHSRAALQRIFAKLEAWLLAADLRVLK